MITTLLNSVRFHNFNRKFRLNSRKILWEIIFCSKSKLNSIVVQWSMRVACIIQCKQWTRWNIQHSTSLSLSSDSIISSRECKKKKFSSSSWIMRKFLVEFPSVVARRPSLNDVKVEENSTTENYVLSFSLFILLAAFILIRKKIEKFFISVKKTTVCKAINAKKERQDSVNQQQQKAKQQQDEKKWEKCLENAISFWQSSYWWVFFLFLVQSAHDCSLISSFDLCKVGFESFLAFLFRKCSECCFWSFLKAFFLLCFNCEYCSHKKLKRLKKDFQLRVKQNFKSDSN